MVCFKENYNFPSFQEGPTYTGVREVQLFQGEGEVDNCLFLWKTIELLIFQVGVSRHSVSPLDLCIVINF